MPGNGCGAGPKARHAHPPRRRAGFWDLPSPRLRASRRPLPPCSPSRRALAVRKRGPEEFLTCY
uniref:Uncharacterized protein n=1 Tax=Setaria viridis TaxID=4556 RepID=A0A4U6SXC5_SETVI|nr:hypothetical protein SEVIR_9G238601v2 [Setaria viridis]